MNLVEANGREPAAMEDPRLARALEEYRARLEAGETPDRDAFAARYPDLAAELSECLEGLEFVHGVVPELHSSAPPLAAAVLFEPEAKLGDYRIVGEAGRGGMGVVYEAVQLSLGRRVALKVLPFAAGLDARRLQRFQHEAQTAAQLHHTNIVPVYGVGCERGVHYFAMQFIEGQTLAAVIRELRQLTGIQVADDGDAAVAICPSPAPVADALTPPTALLSTERLGDKPAFFRTAARLALQAARALDYAHQEGVIHRDIKPANLLVDGRGDLWITDFGLARLQGEGDLTVSGDLIGTLRYMSPEQSLARRDIVDHRSDIYSLGVTLYELLTLEPAFASRDRHELLQQLAHEEPRPPRRIDPAIPAELETIVLEAIAKQPADRYATAGELADDLQRFLDDLPVLARRPTLVEKLTKWARRHRAVVASTVGLFVLTTIGLFISTLLIAREQAATKQALIRSQASFEQARRAVDFFTEVSEAELAGQPTLYGVRRRLLEAALVYYQDFIEQHRDDPSTQAELESCQARVTRLLNELSTLEGSLHLQLLTDHRVQEDLKPTEAQREQFKALAERMGEQRRAAFRDFGQLNEEERRRRFIEMLRDNERAVAELLTPSQQTRLKQIAWQQRGVAAFADPEVETALGLTVEQKRKVRAIRSEVGLAMFNRFETGGPPSLPGRWHGELWRGARDKVLELLTPAQKTKWQELTGEPFKEMRGPWPGGPEPRGPRHPFPKGKPRDERGPGAGKEQASRTDGTVLASRGA